MNDSAKGRGFELSDDSLKHDRDVSAGVAQEQADVAAKICQHGQDGVAVEAGAHLGMQSTLSRGLG